MGIRVGIDLVEVERVREAIDAHAQRYLDRVYSPAEQRDCSTSGIADPVRLAARFAAKEAALKVLRAGDVGISLRDIEVRRDPAGCKLMSLKLARRREFDPEPVIAGLAAAWARATTRLDDVAH